MSVTAVLLTALLTATSLPGQCTPLFPNAALYANSSGQFAVGDFSGDGIPDLATSGPELYLGMGDGRFARTPWTGGPISTHSPILADFDGDGDLDHAALDSNSYGIKVSTNTDGVFGPVRSYGPGTSGGAFAAGDVTGDGFPDLVRSGQQNGMPQILLHRNRGDGTFEQGVPTTTPSGASGLHIADLDGDGRGEVIIAASGSGSFRVYSNEVSGVMTSRLTITQPFGLRAIDVADIDVNGRLDVVVVGAARASVHLNFDGTQFERRRDIMIGTRDTVSVRAADLSGDGIPELVVTNHLRNELRVFPGLPQGEFGPPVVMMEGDWPTCVDVADLNQDGLPDLVVANSLSGIFVTHFNAGSGHFPHLTPITIADNGGSTIAADFDGDGREEIAAEVPSTNTTRILRAQGGTLQPTDEVASGVDTARLAAADLDMDGLVDLLAASYTDRSWTFIRNVGGGFASPVRNAVDVQLYRGFLAADLNGDGASDLVLLGSTEILAMYNDGSGSFPVRQTMVQPSYFSTLILEDMTGDGLPELIAAGVQSGSPRLLIYRNAGSNFAAPQVYPGVESSAGVALAAGDVTGDGLADVLIGTDGRVTVYEGNGDASVEPGQTIQVEGVQYSLNLADFDGDGRLDLFGGSGEDTAFIARGLGGGQFAPSFHAAVSFTPGLLPTDVDGDGRLDLVARVMGNLVVMTNLSAPKVLESPEDGEFCQQPMTLRAAAAVGAIRTVVWEYALATAPEEWHAITAETMPAVGRFTGFDTPTLTLRALDAPASFRARLEGDCGDVTTAPARVSRCCPADFNRDGFVDFFDYADYVTCFELGQCSGDATADFNADDFVDFFDYADFVDAFEQGC